MTPATTRRDRIDRALDAAASAFPFPGYCAALAGAQASVACTVLRHLPEGARILDFGAGPCDKTAVLRALGYACAACDDLMDDWHLITGNRGKILDFASAAGIDFHLAGDGPLPYPAASFDMLMLHDVVEHLHDSPRELLNDLVGYLKPGGLLFITVPNAGNIRKRLALLAGRTNYPDFEHFYWARGPWRGHVREYVRDDLARLATFLGMTVVGLRGCDHMLGRLPVALRPLYKLLTSFAPGLKDTWAMVAAKPADWTPARTLPAERLREVTERLRVYRRPA